MAAVGLGVLEEELETRGAQDLLGVRFTTTISNFLQIRRKESYVVVEKTVPIPT